MWWWYVVKMSLSKRNTLVSKVIWLSLFIRYVWTLHGIEIYTLFLSSDPLKCRYPSISNINIYSTSFKITNKLTPKPRIFLKKSIIVTLYIVRRCDVRCHSNGECLCESLMCCIETSECWRPYNQTDVPLLF